MDAQENLTAQQEYEIGLRSYNKTRRFYYQFWRMGQQTNLKAAIYHYQRALDAISQRINPQLWAALQHALGNAYRDLSDGDYQANLRRAAEHYQNALQVISYSKWSEAQRDWVTSSDRLSKLLEEQVSTLDTPSITRLLWTRSKPQRLLLIVLLLLIVSVGVLSTVLPPAVIAANLGITTGGFACIPGPLSINGSTALRPLIRQMALEYEKKCRGASIDVNKRGASSQGSLNGLNQVNQGQIDIGTSDVFADNAQSNLADHQVAVVIFALVVNHQVTNIRELSTDQIRRIYSNAFNQSGGILQWHDVDARGPSNLDVVRTIRSPSSGTRATFETYVLNSTELVGGPDSLANNTDTTSTIAYNVQSTPGAIGYVSLCYAKLMPACQLDRNEAYIDGEIPPPGQGSNGLIPLQIGQQDAKPETVENNSYKFWSIEHMYTRKDEHNSLANAFINYMFSDDTQKIAKENGFVSIQEMPQATLNSHSSS